jgi:hypothetical protein
MVHRYGMVPKCSIPIAKTEWTTEWNLQVSVLVLFLYINKNPALFLKKILGPDTDRYMRQIVNASTVPHRNVRPSDQFSRLASSFAGTVSRIVCLLPPQLRRNRGGKHQASSLVRPTARTSTRFPERHVLQIVRLLPPIWKLIRAKQVATLCLSDAAPSVLFPDKHKALRP